MKSVHVCFLWHMHQPYYTDPVLKTASMPWVRLHATKAYFDMAWVLEHGAPAAATFNFTPSLLLQIQELLNGTVRDLFLDHAQRPAAELSLNERAFLIRHFFSANWATMVRPHRRYHELLVKRGTEVHGQDLPSLARQFTTQDFLDLQVWHNLAWFGFGAVAQYPRLREFRAKDRGFSEEEKQEVLAIQLQVVAEVLPAYRRLADRGQIELTTSPFYHPILPLVIDSDVSRRARPDLPLPPRFQATEDAAQHIQKAMQLHQEVFGHAPTGMWPSEGSVSPELIPLVQRAGVQWMATDEGVLARSLGASWHRQTMLYQPYRVGEPGQEISMVFRDRELSDAIGFVYHKTTTDSAVDDFFRRIHAIAHETPGSQMLLPIILDGENAWEHYFDGGEGLLRGIYRGLSQETTGERGTPFIRTERMAASIASASTSPHLSTLHSGSWINQDFKIWIGHAEDNRGWELLRHTRDRLLEISDRLSPEQRNGAWEELYAAEGSDWFWWYGDDFESDYRDEFDRLFRTHLRNVFLRAGLVPPEVLDQPIVGQREQKAVRHPVNLISPVLDGRVTDFFEWRGAGSIDPAPPFGAMWMAQEWFTTITFGYDLDTLYLRLDPGKNLLESETALTIEVHAHVEARAYKLTFSGTEPVVGEYVCWHASAAEDVFTNTGLASTICRDAVIEMGIPFARLEAKPGQEIRVAIVVTKEGMELERIPRHAPLVIQVPDATFEASMWRV